LRIINKDDVEMLMRSKNGGEDFPNLVYKRGVGAGFIANAKCDADLSLDSKAGQICPLHTAMAHQVLGQLALQ
jgi:hypothetical protein